MLATRPILENIKPIDPEYLIGDKIQPGHPLFGLIWINPQRVSGAPCFYGSRVPIKNLFDSLAAGETLNSLARVVPVVSLTPPFDVALCGTLYCGLSAIVLLAP